MDNPHALPTVVAEYRDPEDGRMKRMLVVAPNGLPQGRPIFPF